MSHVDYALADPIGSRATFGLVALATDETIEPDLTRMIGAQGEDTGLALYTTRIPFAPEVTPDTLARMETDLPAAVRLLPTALKFDVVGYGCTSGATVIGPERVGELVRSSHSVRHVTDPLSAVMAACDALKVRRIGFVTPYAPDVSEAMRKRLEGHGLEIAGFASFEEPDDATVARIDPASTFGAARHLARKGDCDAVFLSCTNLRTLPVIARAESELAIPVISSNQALAWHMMRLAGVLGGGDGFGRLWSKTLATA